MAGDFTLLVVTHNRPARLRRWLSFHQEIPEDWTILLADSSDQCFEDNKLALASCSHGAAIQHLDFRGTDLEGKIASALKLISTELTMICGEDDYLNISTARRCIEFLIKAPDYAIAQGKVFSFNPYKEKFLTLAHIKPYKQIQNRRNTHHGRLLHHLQNYSANIYTIMRTAILRSSFERLRTIEASRELRERFLMAIPAASGKRMVFDEFFLGREKGSCTIDEYNQPTIQEAKRGSRHANQESHGYQAYEDAMIDLLVAVATEKLSDQTCSRLRKAIQRDDIHLKQRLQRKRKTPKLFKKLRKARSKLSFSWRPDSEKQWVYNVLSSVNAFNREHWQQD